MQAIKETIQTAMGTKLIWASSTCDLHFPKYDYSKFTEQEMENIRRKYSVQKMIVDGVEKCPSCERERLTNLLEEEAKKDAYEILNRGKYNTLAKKSILQDEEIAEARFDNYRTDNEPEAFRNLKMMEQYAQDTLSGQAFNILLYGTPGVGKSHLSYSLLHHVNELSDFTRSCLFIDLDEMLRKIRDSFNNPNSPYTEMYFTKLLSEVDLLVLDDLGAETGNEHTEKKASDFTGRILRAVANSRQKKITIVTTNLSGTQLNKMYDGKTLSRLSKNRKVVMFKETVDKRPLGY